MYSRFKLTYRIGDYFIYQKYFPSVTSAIKTACGFEFYNSSNVQLYDSLTDKIFSHSTIIRLCKEFSDDQVLL